MRLIDIILESNAVEKAKQMGLVKKPGVALYGPPGDENPASHKIRGGELTPLKSSGTKPQSQQTPSATGHATIPISRSAPKEKSTGIRRDVKVAPTPNIEDIAQKIMETISPEGKIEDITQTLSAVTAGFGRKNVARIVEITPQILDMAGVPIYLRQYVPGVYLPEWDIIGVKSNISDKPIDDWEPEETDNLSTYIHESLHSARYRSDNMPDDLPYIWKHDIDEEQFEFIDEGMTEYLTQEIMSDILGDSPQLDLYIEGERSYPVETRAFRLMVEYGGLDVAETFLNKSFTIDEETDEVNWDYIEQIKNAHNTALTNILSKAGFSEEDIVRANITMGLLEEVGSFALFDKNTLQFLSQLIESDFDSTKPPLSVEPDVFLNRLYDFVYARFFRKTNNS